MITIDRNNSKGIYAYKLLDGIGIKYKEEAMRNHGQFKSACLVQDTILNNRLFVFGGGLTERYDKMIGFETDEAEIDLYFDIFELYEANYKANFDN